MSLLKKFLTFSLIIAVLLPFCQINSVDAAKTPVLKIESNKPKTWQPELLVGLFTSNTPVKLQVNIASVIKNAERNNKIKGVNKNSELVISISADKITKHKNYFNTEPTYDESKDEMLQKLREDLKKKIEMKKKKDKQKQEIIKKEFDYKLYDVPEIDFFKPEKNPLYKKKAPDMILSFSKNNKYFNTSTRRLNYSNFLKESKELKKLEKRKEYYKKIFEKNSENISKNLRILKIKINDDNNIIFNKAKCR